MTLPDFGFFNAPRGFVLHKMVWLHSANAADSVSKRKHLQRHLS